jgi:GT2 family glycosyltransferase
MTTSTDVIIVNHNTRAQLGAALASLFAAVPASVAGVVVVDNASTDGSQALVRTAWPQVELIALDRNIGFGAANNVALRRTRSPRVLLLNSDTVVPAGAIDGLQARLDARGASVAGPRLVDAEGRPEVSFGPMLSPWNELRQRWRVRRASRRASSARRATEAHLAHERFVDWISGACLLGHTDAIAAAGYFDERYFLYEEDVDLCAAIRARGGTILYAPSAVVVHERGATVAATPPAGPSHYDASHLAFYEKHLPQWAPWLRRWQRLRGRAAVRDFSTPER